MRVQSKCCIDSCVWIKYAAQFKVSTIIESIIENNLVVYADNYLLGEIHKALVTTFNFTILQADKIIDLISPFLIIKPPRNIYRFSEDAKDNFLYDLCIQNNCRYLITVDRAILKDKNAPFERKTDAWLKKRKA
jgi:putative PIN family toxin of toxin-antitoxin system